MAQLSRRGAVRVGVAGVAATLAARAPDSALAQDEPATFVLVHGAWAGSWAWKKIIPLLRAAGHEVYASTATGMGDRVHLANPAIDLDTHVTDVVNLMEFEDLHNVYLVGWSYGGMIISGVVEKAPERLAMVIHLDADIAADGENGWDAELYTDEARAADIASGIENGAPGYITVDPYIEWIKALMPDPDDQEWMFGKFVPQSLPTYIEPLKVGNPEAAAVPRAFLFCTEGKGDADVDWSVRMAEQVKSDSAWQYRELHDTHFAPINSPEATVEALLSLL